MSPLRCPCDGCARCTASSANAGATCFREFDLAHVGCLLARRVQRERLLNRSDRYRRSLWGRRLVEFDELSDVPPVHGREHREHCVGRFLLIGVNELLRAVDRLCHGVDVGRVGVDEGARHTSANICRSESSSTSPADWLTRTTPS